MRMRATILVLVLMALSAPVFAAPITYTFEFDQAWMYIGSELCQSEPLKVEIAADTTDEYYTNVSSGAYVIPFDAGDGTFTLGSMAATAFLRNGYVFASRNVVGFSIGRSLAQISDERLLGYNLATVAPVSGTGQVGEWTNILTPLGTTTLLAVSGSAHFTGFEKPGPPDPPDPPAVPEPATALLALPFLLVFYRLRAKSAKQS